MCQDVAVYFDLNSKMDFADNGNPSWLAAAACRIYRRPWALRAS